MRTILIILCLSAANFSAADTYTYAIRLSGDLARIDVEARFPAGASRVSARSRNAAEYIRDVRDCDRGLSLEIDGRTISNSMPLHCLTYSVELQRAANIETGAIVLPIASWMWRPRLGGDDKILATFELPDDVAVSMPWQPVPASAPTFRLTSSPQSGTGLAVFGRFEETTVQVGGVDLRIAVIPSSSHAANTDIVEWTRMTADHVALAYGRFPNPHARVLLFPASNRRSDAAVRFGRVVRDGGETVELFVDPSKPEDQFVGDWTATHEFAHLLLPYVDRDERWISEGFAQYYQNVLLARAGRYTDVFAWQKINDGLERGFVSAPGLSPNAAASGDERSARMKIYWSGAALFLMADVELRRRSNGAVTLDTVLDRFQACCLPSRRTWTGSDLFAAFDALLDEPLFADLHRRYADTAGFPQFRPVLDELGVELDGSSVTLRDDAELAEIRAAITAQRYTGEPDN